MAITQEQRLLYFSNPKCPVVYVVRYTTFVVATKTGAVRKSSQKLQFHISLLAKGYLITDEEES